MTIPQQQKTSTEAHSMACYSLDTCVGTQGSTHKSTWAAEQRRTTTSNTRPRSSASTSMLGPALHERWPDTHAQPAMPNKTCTALGTQNSQGRLASDALDLPAAAGQFAVGPDQCSLCCLLRGMSPPQGQQRKVGFSSGHPCAGLGTAARCTGKQTPPHATVARTLCGCRALRLYWQAAAQVQSHLNETATPMQLLYTPQQRLARACITACPQHHTGSMPLMLPATAICFSQELR